MDFQVFNDGELEVIEGLRTLLPAINPEYSDIFVGVSKPASENIAITVRSDGGRVQEKVLKDETFGINVFVEPDSASPTRDWFEFAAILAANVAAAVQNLQKLPNSIKNVILLSGPVRVIAPDLEGEQRYLTISAFRRANTIKTNEG